VVLGSGGGAVEQSLSRSLIRVWNLVIWAYAELGWHDLDDGEREMIRRESKLDH